MFIIPREDESLFDGRWPLLTDRIGSRPIYYFYTDGKMAEAHVFDDEPYTKWYDCSGIKVIIPNEMC